MREIYLYDTTLRDGAQTRGVSFSLQDKLKVTELLDEIGIHFIEGGWPGSNPKDTEFFQIMKNKKLKNATLVAFGSTRRASHKPEDDPVLKALVEAETKQVSIFCKGWDFHVKEALKISLEQNLELIYDSIQYLKRYAPRVALGVEHFYDGFKANPEYVLKIIKAAVDAGAVYVGTADTNGGCLPDEIASILTEVKKHYDIDYSIHAHNDCGLALINTMKAVECGAKYVHGTINGIGERCGMADLCVLIPNLKLKMGIDCISDESLKRLKEVSTVVAELSNFSPSQYTPYVGANAFYHKAGVHMDAMMKNVKAYDHIEPELVGNTYTTAVSELSGRANIIFLAKRWGIDISKDDPKIPELLNFVKSQEEFGFQFEGAEASQFILFKQRLQGFMNPIEVDEFNFSMKKAEPGKSALDESITPKVEVHVQMKVQGQPEEVTLTQGKGPLEALGVAIREGVDRHYRGIAQSVQTTDIKIRVLDYVQKTSIHKLRIWLQLMDLESGEVFNTVGASHDIYTAFIKAYRDGLCYKILKSYS